jgi:hypothetical protein
MRGRRPVGPEYANKLAGSDTAKLRAKVILQTIAGTLRVQDACELLGVCEQRFHQLRQEMMEAALKALEPGHAGRPAHAPTPAEQQVTELEQQLADQAVELQAAKARAEIALVLPEVQHEPDPLTPRPPGEEPGVKDEPKKKTPAAAPTRRRRGRKKNT